MSLDLRRKVEEKLQEAEIQSQKIETAIDLFEETCKRTINDCLRSKLIQEINTITNRIFEQASAKETEFREYPTLYEDKVVGVQAIRNENHGLIYFDFSPVEMKRESFDYVAVKMEKKHPSMKIISLENFSSKIDKLRNLIFTSEDEQFLRSTGDEALWRIIKNNR